jgi:hypothetical protein
MRSRVGFAAAMMLLAACGRKVDGVLYSTTEGAGQRLANREVVAVPATGSTERALRKFCAEQAKHGADADTLRSRLERRSVQLMGDANRERARNGWSKRWRQLVNRSESTTDSARAVPLFEAMAGSGKLAQQLASARATTNGDGEFHLTKVSMGKVILVATADDDWGDVISVGPFRPTKADLGLDQAMPGCILGAGFRR